jgi:hypothetical protein
VGCVNEHVLIPMQNAGQWATRTDPITEESIWVRADDAARLTEQLLARAVAGDPVLQPESLPQPKWSTFALYHLLRLDVRLWALFTAPFRRVRRTALRG